MNTALILSIWTNKYFYICMSFDYLNWLRFRMGDGAREITKAGEEVFGNVGVRLMCWPHTYRNLVPRMSAQKNVNKKMQEQLMSDIENLQWSVHSEETFRIVFDLLEAKYVL